MRTRSVAVVLDKRDNKTADTGKFELAFKDTQQIASSKCVDTKFVIEGQRIKRLDLAKYNQIDQEEAKKEVALELKKKQPKVRTVCWCVVPCRVRRDERLCQIRRGVCQLCLRVD